MSNLIIGVGLVLGIGMSPLGYALMLPLGERFPQWDASRGTPSGIIVLGGAIVPEMSVARGEITSRGRPCASVSDGANRLLWWKWKSEYDDVSGPEKAVECSRELAYSLI
jgi:hypothetical protein